MIFLALPYLVRYLNPNVCCRPVVDLSALIELCIFGGILTGYSGDGRSNSVYFRHEVNLRQKDALYPFNIQYTRPFG